MSWIKRWFGGRRARLDNASPPGELPNFAAFPNPGLGPTLEVGFSDAQGTWSEAADLVELLAEVIARVASPCEIDQQSVRLPDGLLLAPQIVSVQPIDGRMGASTSTVIAASHPRAFPAGMFEWQHARGASSPAAITTGFEQWASCDLPALRHAVQDDADESAMLLITRHDGRRRRVVLGPILGAGPAADESDHGPSCACCLFTHSGKAFRALLEGDAVYGLRLFAARTADGEVMADCRVNGADFLAGAEALRAYAQTWTGETFQMRKQYVIVQSMT